MPLLDWDRAFQVACTCCKADADVPEVEAVIVLLLSLVRDAYVAALLAALVGSPFPPLSAEALQTVERAASSLTTAASELNGLPLPADISAQASLAARQLQLQLQDLVTKTAAEAVPALSTPGSLASPEALRGELEAALDAEQALRPLVDGWAYQTFNAASIRAAAADGHNFIQLHAQIDSKTTAFCRLVDGRVVPMAVAQGQLAAIEAATLSGDVEALRLAAPFIDRPDRATQADVDAAIARGGLAPFHHGCRTRNVPVRLSVP